MSRYAKANTFVWSLCILRMYCYKAGPFYNLEICVIFNIQRNVNANPEASKEKFF